MKAEKIKKGFKLILINIFILLGLLLFLNLFVLVFYPFFKNTNQNSSLDLKANLPNYKNIIWAEKHFKEFAELKSEYRSFIGWRRLPYKGLTININDEGVRNTPQHKSSSEKSPLIVFLGGSTMWGTGVNDSTTIPAYFAQISEGKYRVLNYAETAYNAFQSFLFLRLQMINGVKPDIIISYDGVNDAYCLLKGNKPFGHYRDNQIRNVMRGKDYEKQEVMSVKNFLFNPLQSVIADIKKSKDKKNPVKKKTEQSYNLNLESVDKAAVALLESWVSMKDIADKNNAIFLAILQPNIATGYPNKSHLKIDTEKQEVFKIFYSRVLCLIKSSKYKSISKNIVIQTNAFNLNEFIYIDECHVSPNGNHIIAAIVYNYFKNTIKN